MPKKILIRMQQGKSVTVGWLDYDPRLKPGVIVSLKGHEGWWRVVDSSRPVGETINRGWNNNI